MLSVALASKIWVRVKERMQGATTANIAFPRSPVLVTVPLNSSFENLRHLIGLAFDLPSDLEVAIYFTKIPKSTVDAGNVNQATKCRELAIEFDAQKSANF